MIIGESPAIVSSIFNNLSAYIPGSATNTIGQHTPLNVNPVTYDGADQITLEEVSSYL